ncbi:MAG: arginine--tRNA ligase [Elusimicrobia bacterium RIFCSPLOWO2_02_FULL_39_32]|nr:MAG: arginine--tRNA ligase [Elusimicrobia bacterium GWA2_38_7]OGR81207.1 MAG: arginine--tRNA ligase [Elusimicrobia bacterium RIFCSPHIGHO2_02_FULL_39_36]OGR91759.1 MAG: arginine--tRNA ligase [Elusimicrobia bacterium RIFCSPLOWO2_02_FULL_39_32]OGR98419.1 MAG: arginine--tRNA ligase [Elusimicrobia bacterium RIFCSPLOWO2_12_FULL_39_28]
MIKQVIKKKILELITKEYPQIPSLEFMVDEPASEIEADLCSNAAFPLGKLLNCPPFEVAKLLSEKILDSSIFKKIEVSKNGFLNFILEDKALRKIIWEISQGNGDYLGETHKKSSERILLEFVSANPTGPLHIGHGRGAALGDSLYRIYRQCGFNVEREYYVNDVGFQMQTLAHSVEARYLQLQGNKEVQLPENGYQGDYIKELAKTMLDLKKSDFNTYPKEFLLDTIRQDLADFGVSFEHWMRESSLHLSGKLDSVLEFLDSKKSLAAKDGALWFVGEANSKEELDKERVIKKSDGKFTYFASDIAYHKDKWDRGYTHCIDIWGHDHHGYVPRMVSAVGALGIPKDFLKIQLYQLVSLKRGGKKVAMSTRSGEFVPLKEVVDEVGRDAARFFFALRSPTSHLEFDIDLAKKKSNENPVYYAQYVHARICSIFSEAKKRGIDLEVSFKDLEGKCVEKEERELMKKISFFKDILESSLQVSSPHLLANYLIDTATKFHRFYDQHRVLDVEPSLMRARLILLLATKRIFETGLNLLGVSAPESM